MKPLGENDPAAVGSYRLLGVLGGGGMGRVYLGESRSGRRVAIKVVRSELAEDTSFRRRFAREVESIQSVSPLFTAAVVEFDTEAGAPWVATTYIEGPTLGELVGSAGPMAGGAVLTLAAGLAEAVASIHRVGLVHRDIKPSNVIINDLGPHVIDFGIALAQDSAALTTSVLLGTPSYIAPEIIQGGDPSPASDIFSLGSTLVFAASGRHLVNEGNMHSQILRMTMGRFDLAAVPKELRPLIVRCLSPRAKDRPTADELARIIVASGSASPAPGWYARTDPAPPVEVPPLPITLSGHRTVSRRAVIVAGVATVAVAGTGVGVALALSRRPAKQFADPIATTTQPPTPTGSVGPTTVPRHAGSVLWTATSGVDPAAASTGDRSNGSRIVVFPDRIIAANAGRVYAMNQSGAQLWTKTLSNGLLTLYRFADGVLVTDPRTAWYFTAAGEQKFALNLADTELATATGEGQTQPAPEIGAVAVGDGRAYVGLGTAVFPIDPAGKQGWRGSRTTTNPVGTPLSAGRNQLVTHDPLGIVGGKTQVRIWLRNGDNGAKLWHQDYAPTPFQSPAGPPGGPPGGPAPAGPGYDDAWEAIEAAIGAGQIVVRDSQEVRVFNVGDSGRPLWVKSSQTPVTSMRLLGDLVVIAADRIRAYSVVSGQQRWELDVQGARMAPTPDGSRLVAVGGQTVAALGPGGQLWRAPAPLELDEAGVGDLYVTAHEVYLTLTARGDQGDRRNADVVAIALD